jgi:hypothetical protein
MPIKVMPSFNSELKNLNLKAVENIVLQKIIEEKSSRSNQLFMKHRKAKYVHFNIFNASETQFSNFRKPLSAQTSERGIYQFHDFPIQRSKVGQNFNQRALNEQNIMRKIKELDEEMKKIGDDSESEKELEVKDENKPKQTTQKQEKNKGVKPILQQIPNKIKTNSKFKIEKHSFIK